MRWPRSRRGISPVIGTVLLVAIVVLLATTSAYIVFGLTEEREPAPEVTFEFEPADPPAGYELTLTNGEKLDGEKVRLRGAANEDALAHRDLLAGDSVTVFPTDERVELVWFGENGSSYVLREFGVDPGVPEADKGCPWLSGRTTADIDFVLHCDVVLSGDVNLESGGTVVGKVVSENNFVDIDNGGLTVYGPVRADRSVDIDDSNVTGTVTAGDDVATDGAHIWGDVRGTDVDLGDTVVYGSVKSTGPVSLDGATVHGHVYASSGSLSCIDSPTINGEPCSSYTSKDPDDY